MFFVIWNFTKYVMIEVFKTSVQNQLQARIVRQLLLVENPLLEINFDLEDCDKILRVEREIIFVERIIAFINSKGYECEHLV